MEKAGIVYKEIPTEDELTTRISMHLERRDDKQAVALVWGGYLAALVEWSLISPQVHGRLVDLLPKGDRSEVVNLLTGLHGPEE